MRFLLDTHIWLWAVGDPDRLAPRVRDSLADPTAEIWLSPVTIWETLILFRNGRLQMNLNPHIWIRERLAQGPYREAPLTWEIAFESRLLELEHEDPGDRFLVATARVLNLTLVTADHRLIRASGFQVMANV
ncbi:MAG: type II toxin-antitoxin system VapC family toxin [Acidobacteriota bacterium]